MNIKIATHIMPWDIDYALLMAIQLKKSKYHLPADVNITLDTDVGWEILLNEYDEANQVAQAPFVVTVNCAFKPIMDILPRRAKDLTDIPSLLANGLIADTQQQPALKAQSNQTQNETRNLINEGAASRQVLSDLEQSDIFTRVIF
jgi:hypothetical protein